jgi:hypothetical protein
VGCVPIAHAPHAQALLVLGPSTRFTGAAVAKPVGHAAVWFGASVTNVHPLGMV